MKQVYSKIIVVLFFFNQSMAQTASDYTAISSTGASLYNMSGSTQLIGKQQDQQRSYLANIGFDFYFERIPYSQFSVESNGLMKLGGTQISIESANNITSSLNKPKMSTFWDDLSTGLNGKVHYKLVGDAPNRVLVVEFNLYYNYGVYSSYNQTSQICLFEGSNEIRFIYGSGQFWSNTATVGIGGVNPSNYLVRNHSTNHTFGNTSAVQTINEWPGAGRQYRFIPAYNYWTGNVSSTWETPGNWSLGFVPTSIDRAFIPVTINHPIVNSVDSVYRVETALGTVLTLNTGQLTSIENIENDGTIEINDARLSVRGDYNATEAFTTMTHTNSTLEIAGTYTSVGSMSTDIGTTEFTGINQGLNSGSFHSIHLLNEGTSQLQGDVSVHGNLLIDNNNNSLNLNGFKLSIGGHLTVNTFNGLDVSNSISEVEFIGSQDQNLYFLGTDSEEFKNVKVNKTSGELVLQHDLSISDQLTLAGGIVELNGYNLILGTTLSNANVSGGNSTSYVRSYENGINTGKLIHHINSTAGTEYYFPIGQSEFNPVFLTMKAGQLSNALVEVWTKNAKVSTMNDNVQCYIDRSWFIEPIGISEPTYDVSLMYSDGEFQGDFFIELLPVKLSSGDWYVPTNSVMQGDFNQGEGYHNTETNTLTWTNLTSFSEFGGAGGSTPLPVELSAFNANCTDLGADIEWTTSSEYNSAYFDVLFSDTGSEWTVIGQLNALGNSQDEHSYYMAHRMENAIGYYKLIQVDLDGESKEYGPIYMNCDQPKVSASVFPNPSAGSFNLTLQAPEAAVYEMKMYNAQNQLVITKELQCQEGINLFYENKVILSKGLYLITLVSDQHTFLFKHWVSE